MRSAPSATGRQSGNRRKPWCAQRPAQIGACTDTPAPVSAESRCTGTVLKRFFSFTGPPWKRLRREQNPPGRRAAAPSDRPSWNVSFYINTDAATLLGTDTFENGAVQLRKGPIYQCAETGGFGVLDEINMAKNESLAVLHATLDFRRSIDMPGYERIPLHDATRFIATMNYGYAGTRELNEALASRFVVIDMPAITTEGLIKLLKREFPSLKGVYAEQFAGLFQDIQKKCDGGELSTKPLDLRGLLAAVRLMRTGLEGNRALDLGLVNKSFDDFERQLVRDVIRTRLPETLRREDVFD